MATWLHELIENKPSAAPAVIDPDGTRLSYGGLRDRVSEIRALLSNGGVLPGDRVMLVLENCADYIAVAMACSQLKAWVMPVNARHTLPELEALQAHAKPRVVVRTGPSLQIAPGSADAAPEPVQSDPANQVAALMYTTGTTSAPKGVMLSHANLTWNAAGSVRLRGMRPDDTVLGVLPGSHIFGFSSMMLATLHVGACLRFMRFEPAAVLDALAQGASVMPAVPQMYAVLLEHIARTGVTVSAPKLHYISAGGAPLDPDWKARVEGLFGLALNNGYGITEASPTVAATRIDAARADISVGPAVWDVTLSIDNPDAEGVGEVLVDGPGVMMGYYKNPEATAQALPRPGLLRTGDLGRLDPDGTLWIEGRKKELIIRSGFNVYPPEIEAMLTRHPKVHLAAVIGHARAGNEDILAFVKATATVEDIQDWLRARLAPYKQPQAIFLVDSFPVAPTGKILKHKLVTHFADRVAAWEASDGSDI